MLGGLQQVEPVEEMPRETEGWDLPWDQPYLALVSFGLPNGQRNGRDSPRSADAFVDGLPPTGFLERTAAGDLSLIARHRKALQRLAQQSSFAPLLAAYLFDIRQAHVPQQLVEVTEWYLPYLNDDQKLAVRKMLSVPDLGLIQGPPGTGKTDVIAELAHQFARMGKRVVIASQTHVAVDNALERLKHSNAVRAIRLGRPDKMDEACPFTEERALGCLYRNLARSLRGRFLEAWAALDARIARAEERLRNGDVLARDIERFQADLDRLRREQADFQDELRREQESLDAARERERQIEHLSDSSAAWTESSTVSSSCRRPFWARSTTESSWPSPLSPTRGSP